MNAFIRYGVMALAALVVTAGATPAFSASPKAAQQETVLDVKAKLDSFAQTHVSRANKTLTPNRASVQVTKTKNGYVAKFLEIDRDTLTTEIYPSNAPGCAYVGHVVYLEKVFECVGKTKAQAQKGEFKQTKARRIRELTRYDGKKGAWIY